MTKVIPVILAGGSGTRLWPLSRKSYPKQFSKLFGDYSLFQQSLLRLKSSESIYFLKPIILTNSDFRFIVVDQLQEINIDPEQILIEPVGRNTGPAILAASLLSLKNDPESLLLVAPSDHVVLDEKEFHVALKFGLAEAKKNNIVTFGIAPNCPETGYGYMEMASIANQNPVKINRFVEKPDLKTAEKMVASKTYLWNSGIFMFKASDGLKAFEMHAPSLVNPVKSAVRKGKKDLGFYRLDAISWKDCDDISIDYAVMERADNLIAIPVSAGWSDLGDWNAVWKEQQPDSKGLAHTENVTLIDCENVLFRAESKNQHLVGIGLDNIVAIAMPDAVLVANKNRVQDVKHAVTILKEQNIQQAELSSKDYRPWGWFEILASERQFKVKRILVNPGAALSLQSHRYRSEHWVVVEGSIQVTINEQVQILTKGQSAFVPVGAVHRMENVSKVPMILIEVQTGTYLGEDDIFRYEDIYARE